MCDTMVRVEHGRVLFAKNSDREPNEAQVLEWHPARTYPAGQTVRCTHTTVPQVRRTHAVLISRPFWMWGAEMGTNEHGVTIGNEAVFTRQRLDEVGLTGMDVLRLALERAATAREAVDVIVDLVERHGQGGRCSLGDPRFRYASSFLVADPTTAFVVETAGRQWAVEPVHRGVRAISNGLTIADFARRHTRWLPTWASRCATRRARATEGMHAVRGPADVAAVLRDHGAGRTWPRYDPLLGTLDAICMHGGGLVSAQTTASWVAELRPGRVQHWVTATAAPCTGLFRPVRVDRPVSTGPRPTQVDDGRSLWWRHEVLHRLAMRDPARALATYRDERDALERAWFAAPPDPVEAFEEAARRLRLWTARVRTAVVGDRRPWWVRRAWRRHDRTARLRLA